MDLQKLREEAPKMSTQKLADEAANAILEHCIATNQMPIQPIVCEYSIRIGGVGVVVTVEVSRIEKAAPVFPPVKPTSTAESGMNGRH